MLSFCTYAGSNKPTYQKEIKIRARARFLRGLI